MKYIASLALTVLVFGLAAGSRPCGAASVTQRYEEAARLLDAWRFEEAFRLAHVLLIEDPKAPLALSLMGRVQYYLGNYGLALRYLSQSPKRVPVEGTFSSLRGLVAATLEATKDFKEIIGERFVVRFEEGKDSLLAEGLIDALQEARVEVGRDLNCHPPGRLVVEVYPDVQRFLLVSGFSRQELHNSRIPGACKDNRLLILSPQATVSGYLWQDAVCHLYVNYVVKRKTNRLCPSWLEEGLANHGEVRWRKPEGRNLYPIEEHVLRLALEKGEFNASSELEPRLLKLLGPDSTWLHSARVTSQVRFLLSRWGYDMVHRILERISTGADIDGALRETLGLSLVQFHKEWKKHVEANPPRKLPGIVVRVPQLREKSPPERASLPDEETTGPALSHLRAGDLLLENGNIESSILEYQKALDVCPVSLEGFQKLASAYAWGGRPERALETLAKAVSLYPDEAALYIQIADVYWDQANLEEALTFFSESTRIDPFNPYVYRSRSSIYRERGMARDAYEEIKKAEMIEEKESTP